MKAKREPNKGALWVVTLLYAALIFTIGVIAQDRFAAQMAALLGGLGIPLLCALHSATT